MLHFDTDYKCGGHPEVMKRLVATNMDACAGYGYDEFTANARKLILEACGLSEGDVRLLVGGTQTNATVIDALLSQTEGVISTDAAHINVHEAGAIEASGHKVIVIPSVDGKLTSEGIDQYINNFYADDTWAHMVIPGMVYITQPTEYGTLYSLADLTKISETCRRHGIPLYLDGARLAYALASPEADFTLPDIARLCDAFYIGGTKCGALFGEAVVLPRPELTKHFFTLVKQHGALFAKGRVIGAQFEALFTDELYRRVGENGVKMALRLRQGFVNKGYKVYIDSPTNQQFFILPNEVVDALLKVATFGYWGARGERESAVRFVTDWSTTEAEVEALVAALPAASR